MAASETSESNSLKRQRICEDSFQSPKKTLPHAPATRSDTVWLDDGNVILHVENTLFRVHRSFLAANSGIFDDMFKVGQPSSGDSMEGCPVVYMHDAMGDWETLLTTIYYPLKIHPSQAELSPVQLIALLRLGKKYQFDRIFQGALARLKSEFPQSLAEYDAKFDLYHMNEPLQCKIRGQNTKPCTYMGCATWSLFDLTNVMLELGIFTTLPMAYYMCSIRPGEIIFNGCSRPDNTIARLSYQAQNTIFSSRDTLNNGRINLQWLYGSTNPEHTVPTPSCESIEQCKRESTKWMKFFRRGISTSLGHPLYRVVNSVFFGFCDECSQAKGWHQDERTAFWRSLPNSFKLPDWADLSD